MSKEAMKLALKVLKNSDGAMPFPVDKGAIKALEEALAKQEQGEPVAVVIEESTFDGYHRKGIAWNFRLDSFDIGTKFYTTPQQREWVGLTDEQINKAAMKLAECMDYPWAHMPEEGRREMRNHAKAAIEAAHDIKE